VGAIARDGVTLAYEESGDGDPPFVFVHGWTCNHTHFAPQLAHFSARHRVVAVDLRGHGRSDAPEEPYAIATFADDVAWLCHELGVERPVVVGHSMGGAVVLELAARHPELPRAIVMLDAAPVTKASEAAAIAAELSKNLRGPDAATIRAALVDQTTATLACEPSVQEAVRRDMLATADHVALSCLEALGDWDGEAAARGCTVPALHIGADDPINDAAALRALNPLIRTGQTVGAGHFNQLEAPDQVNAMIERFLLVTAGAP